MIDVVYIHLMQLKHRYATGFLFVNIPLSGSHICETIWKKWRVCSTVNRYGWRWCASRSRCSTCKWLDLLLCSIVCLICYWKFRSKFQSQNQLFKLIKLFKDPYPNPLYINKYVISNSNLLVLVITVSIFAVKNEINISKDDDWHLPADSIYLLTAW